MKFSLNGVPLPGLPTGTCPCYTTGVSSLEITDPAVLAALRPQNNVLTVDGFIPNDYLALGWARVTVHVEGAADIIAAAINPGNVGTYFCNNYTTGNSAGVFGDVPVEMCDGGSTCTDCETPLPETCADIHDADRTLGDGSYAIFPSAGFGYPTTVYCDMTNGGVTYEAMGFGQWDAYYPGWQRLGVADIADPIIQDAFLTLYAQQGGLLNLNVGGTSYNCCFRADADNVYTFGGSYLYPADVNSDDISSNCGGPYDGALMWIHTAPLSGYADTMDPRVSSTYFDNYPASAGDYCYDPAGNPSFFMKRY
jgi:hypothetical protein